MFKFLVIVALATFASGATLPRTLRQRDLSWLPGRIVGGEDTTIENVPYQISLRYFGSHNCGGSIISRNYIITAAHCANGMSIGYVVHAGTTHRLWGGSKHSVDRIIVHENYRLNVRGLPVNDIALMHVKEPFHFDSTRQPISLFKTYEESVAGSKAVITGWGTTGGSQLSSNLKLAVVPIVTKAFCNKQYGGIPDGQICAGYPKGKKDTCQGDSGGPLTIHGRLAGIVSWGKGCALAGYPGAYTEIASYRQWIKNNSGI